MKLPKDDPARTGPAGAEFVLRTGFASGIPSIVTIMTHVPVALGQRTQGFVARLDCAGFRAFRSLPRSARLLYACRDSLQCSPQCQPARVPAIPAFEQRWASQQRLCPKRAGSRDLRGTRTAENVACRPGARERRAAAPGPRARPQQAEHMQQALEGLPRGGRLPARGEISRFLRGHGHVRRRRQQVRRKRQRVHLDRRERPRPRCLQGIRDERRRDDGTAPALQEPRRGRPLRRRVRLGDYKRRGEGRARPEQVPGGRNARAPRHRAGQLRAVRELPVERQRCRRKLGDGDGLGCGPGLCPPSG